MKKIIVIDCTKKCNPDFSFKSQTDSQRYKEQLSDPNNVFIFICERVSPKTIKLLKRAFNIRKNDSFLISSQGAKITQLNDGRPLKTSILSKNELYAPYLYALMHDLDCAIISEKEIVSTSQNIAFLKEESKNLKLKIRESHDFIDNPTSSSELIIYGDVYKINMIDQTLKNLFKNTVQIVRNHPNYYTLTRKDCSVEDAITAIQNLVIN